MGLGGGPGEWDDYEWFPTNGPARPPARARRTQPDEDPDAADRLVELVERSSPWEPGDAPRILLVDLDNLRAAPTRWKARMAVVVALARQADHVALAGQAGPVRRAKPHLHEFAGAAVAVPTGSDLADVALLERVDELDLPDAQSLVVSNDNIFAELAHCGPLVVLSPGRDALSDALERASTRVVDLAALEQELSNPVHA